MSTRQAVWGGWVALTEWPGITSASALTSGVALSASLAAGARAWSLAQLSIERGAGGLFGRALFLALAGFGFAALFAELGRACALVAYAGPGRRARRNPVWRGLACTPAIVTLRALELLLYGMLLVGVGLALTKIVGISTVRGAFAGALVTAPALALSLFVFAATRVAIVLAARGARAAPSLVRGCDLTLRRFPSLIRLALALAVATSPFTLGALVLTIAAHHTSPNAAIALALCRAVSLALAALWCYAALSALAGSDPRLAGG
jgi:hypothetical protein